MDDNFKRQCRDERDKLKRGIAWWLDDLEDPPIAERRVLSDDEIARIKSKNLPVLCMVVSPEVADAIDEEPGAVRVVVKKKDGSTLVCGPGLRQTTPLICRDKVDLEKGAADNSDLAIRFLWASCDQLLKWIEHGLFGQAAEYCQRAIKLHTGQVKYFTAKLEGLNRALTQFSEEQLVQAAKGMRLDTTQKEFKPLRMRPIRP
jgi:hypothetical protein